jgi:hypothetical protein
LEHFPQNKIFMNLDRVAHGEDLVKTIEKAIESSDIFIAVIGKTTRRNRKDFARWGTSRQDHFSD